MCFLTKDTIQRYTTDFEKTCHANNKGYLTSVSETQLLTSSPVCLK